MSYISKIRLPTNDEYDFKDSESIHSVAYNGQYTTVTKGDGTTANYGAFGQEYQTATYTGLIGETASDEDTSFYFMKIIPVAFNQPWSVRYRINMAVTGYVNYWNLASEVTVIGREDYNYPTNQICSTRVAQNVLGVKSANNIAMYSDVYPLTYSGRNAGYANAVGVSLYHASSNTNTARPRQLTVSIVDRWGCTVDFLPTAVKWSDWEGSDVENAYGPRDRVMLTTGPTVVETQVESNQTIANGLSSFTVSYSKQHYSCYLLNITPARTDNAVYAYVRSIQEGTATVDVVNTGEAYTGSIGTTFWLCIPK